MLQYQLQQNHSSHCFSGVILGSPTHCSITWIGHTTPQHQNSIPLWCHSREWDHVYGTTARIWGPRKGGLGHEVDEKHFQNKIGKQGLESYVWQGSKGLRLLAITEQVVYLLMTNPHWHHKFCCSCQQFHFCKFLPCREWAVQGITQREMGHQWPWTSQVHTGNCYIP